MANEGLPAGAQSRLTAVPYSDAKQLGAVGLQEGYYFVVRMKSVRSTLQHTWCRSHSVLCVVENSPCSPPATGLHALWNVLQGGLHKPRAFRLLVCEEA